MCGMPSGGDITAVMDERPIVTEELPQEPTMRGSDDPFLGQVLDRRYRLDECIGQGGMALVYRATHTLIGRTLAIKLLRPELANDNDLVERFLREARCASAVKHPNVVELSDYGQLPGGGAFYVMEFLRGRTLAQRIDADGPIAPAEALEIALQICCGLEAIHAEGIVHRDLKSENVFLCESDRGRVNAKVLDFGVARTRAKRLTAIGAILGTPEYMSPEQAMGKDVDRRSDIYSLGVIVFEMLTGLVPFASTDIALTIESQIHGVPPLLRSVRPEVTAPLVATEDVVRQMLVKDRNQRTPSSTHAREALQAALAADLGRETAARVRATLAIGSGALSDVSSDHRPVEAISAGSPMDWGGVEPGGARDLDQAPSEEPHPALATARFSRPRWARFPLILGAAAACSAAGSVAAYALALQLGALAPPVAGAGTESTKTASTSAAIPSPYSANVAATSSQAPRASESASSDVDVHENEGLEPRIALDVAVAAEVTRSAASDPKAEVELQPKPLEPAGDDTQPAPVGIEASSLPSGESNPPRARSTIRRKRPARPATPPTPTEGPSLGPTVSDPHEADPALPTETERESGSHDSTFLTTPKPIQPGDLRDPFAGN